jgi:hypothetical protein
VQSGGDSTLISIMLEEIASCGIARVQQPILLALAAISFVLGAVLGSMADGSSVPLMISVIVAVVFVGLYFSGRQHVLVLASAGSTIRADVRTMDAETVIALIDQLEFAKNSRYLLNNRRV